MNAGDEKTGRIASGKIISDPTAASKVGDKIYFDPTQFKPQKTSGLTNILNWDFFGGVLLLLFIRRGSDCSIIGSACMVGPGIAITASHVVREAVRDGFAITAISIHQDHLEIWRALRIPHGDDDLAILCLELASDIPDNRSFRQSILSTRLPRKGETVMICGFRAWDMQYNFDSQLQLDFTGHVYISVGDVTDVYPEKRDAVMLPWPCFEIDTPTIGAMSGGPVFDENGNVIGILSTSFSSGPPSYASCIYPVISREINPFWPTGIYSGRTSLFDLAQKTVRIVGKDQIRPGGSNGPDIYAPWT